MAWNMRNIKSKLYIPSVQASHVLYTHVYLVKDDFLQSRYFLLFAPEHKAMTTLRQMQIYT